VTAATPLPAAVTPAAPHVRDAINVAGVMRTTTVALLPCVLAGAYGAGRQIHLALGDQDLSAAAWHGWLLDALGFTVNASNMVTCTLHGLLAALPLFIVSLVVVNGWEVIFAKARGRARVPGALLVAVLFTLAVPATMHWWQAAIGLSFGVVLGKEVFGGTGRNIVHPAVAAITFLALAWPESLRGDAVWVPVEGATGSTLFNQAATSGVIALESSGVGWTDALLGSGPGPLGGFSPLACLLGALYLIATSLISWRTVVAVFAGTIAAAWLFQLLDLAQGPAADIPATWHVVLGSLAFGTVFLATDPVTSPVTNAGRWMHGLLLGGVIVMIRVGNPTHPEGTYLALLLGSIFAPLNDAVVVWAHTRRRRARG